MWRYFWWFAERRTVKEIRIFTRAYFCITSWFYDNFSGSYYETWLRSKLLIFCNAEPRRQVAWARSQIGRVSCPTSICHEMSFSREGRSLSVRIALFNRRMPLPRNIRGIIFSYETTLAKFDYGALIFKQMVEFEGGERKFQITSPQLGSESNKLS